MYIDSDMVRLKHILDAAREAVDFAKGQSRHIKKNPGFYSSPL